MKHRSRRPPGQVARDAPATRTGDAVRPDTGKTEGGQPGSPKSESATMMAQRASLAPDPRSGIPAVFLKGYSHHPLLYRKRIARADPARPGDLVAVYSDSQQLIGYGLYNPRSEITVRMLWHTQDLPTDAAWDEKLRVAAALRRDLLHLDRETSACRLVHAEADGLSGMVVDKFGDVLSAETFGLGMYQRARGILERLAPLCEAHHWFVRPSPQFLSQEGCAPPELNSENCPTQVVIHEYGTRFRVRFDGRHKTGFFCDQRENRRRLAAFCEGRSVLDLCCYTGGFAVQAAVLGKAGEVIGADIDEEPLRLARENANLNQARIRFVQADAFSYMRELIRNGRQFDVVCLDPPKLIRTRQEIEEGTRKHFALNRLAMRLVKPGGLLLSCCCAGLLSESAFLELLIAASRQSGDELSPETETRGATYASRTLQIIARTGAAPDHPVISTCAETEYLKAVWMVMS